MYIICVILLLRIFQANHATLTDYISVMTPEKGSASSSHPTEPVNVLPLTLIDLGESCINPTKVEAAAWIDKDEQLLLGGGTKFSAETKGDQKFMCAIKKLSTESADAMPSNDQNCTYPIKFKETDYLECVQEPEPYISELKIVTGPISITNNVRCGQGGRGKMYRYVYKICVTDNPIEMLFGFNLFKIDSVKYRSELEMYRFCFDEQENTVLYTEHRIYSPNLLIEHALDEDRKRKYEMTTHNHYVFGLNSDGSERQFNWLTIPNETQIVSDHLPSSKKPFSLSKPQKLVPAEDFAFALWRKPTYDFLNTKKIQNVLVGLWDYINGLIRNDAIKHNREYYIKTEVFHLNLPHSMISNETNTLEPHIWMKKIFYFPNFTPGLVNSRKNQAIIVLMANYSSPKIDSELKRRCVNNLCSSVFFEEFPGAEKLVYCCSMISNEAFSEEGPEIHEDLEINLLTDVTNSGNERKTADDTEKT